MNKDLEKLLDKSIKVLADNDDKKEQERYHLLQSAIEQTQEYLESNNYSKELSNDLTNELNVSIKRFKNTKVPFIIFLVILCTIIFSGAFYVSYSYFYDFFYNGGEIVPPKTTTTKTTRKISTTGDVTDRVTDPAESTTTNKTAKTTKKANKTTKKNNSNDNSKTTKKNTTNDGGKKTTSSNVIDDDPNVPEFVTVVFDNGELIDLNNIIPLDDNDGLNTTPVTWKLNSTLSKGSKNYKITYSIDFIDKIEDISSSELLDITKLKYQLLIKKNGSVYSDTGVQLMADYPEVENGIRPIITGSYNKGEELSFELRMWLDSSTDNSQQGKKYRFKINVQASYDFMN